jgi:hypothetical protein
LGCPTTDKINSDNTRACIPNAINLDINGDSEIFANRIRRRNELALAEILAADVDVCDGEIG